MTILLQTVMLNEIVVQVIEIKAPFYVFIYIFIMYSLIQIFCLIAPIVN